MKEILTIPQDPLMEHLAEICPDVVFAAPDGKELKMQIIRPWTFEGDMRRYPLIVFLQGSAWTFPNVNYEIPQLSRYAQAGFVVATLTHRNALEGNPFPAFLEDTKSAIRFLKANAETYHIDPAHICFWGTSSGGNTALLVAVTGDEKQFDVGENLEVDSKVNCVVECFGPTNLPGMAKPLYTPEQDVPGALFYELCGGPVMEHIDVLERMSPVSYVTPGKDFPPVLLIHGSADPVVPYSQGTEMYKKLKENGYSASMICVEDAPHEGPFWSVRLHELILEYIRKHI
ncbi:MAG: alpha/beta hydrolase fold domain-containing protein [Christensenellales bacterium]|jgi:acetyl esterase/lipase